MSIELQDVFVATTDRWRMRHNLCVGEAVRYLISMRLTPGGRKVIVDCDMSGATAHSLVHDETPSPST
jgi:hypothetical protein